MKKIIYAIYLFGAVLASVVGYFLDPITALAIVLVMPMIVITVLEMKEIIKFSQHNLQDDDSVLGRAMREDLTSEEAAEKYGQALVNEMDEEIKQQELNIMEMRKARDDTSDAVRGIKK